MHRRVDVQIEHGPHLICLSPTDLAVSVGDLCVVKTERSLEVGAVVRIEEQSRAAETERLPVVLRRATLQDQSKASENAVMSKMAQDLCVKKMGQMGLQMHLIHVRYSFDRAVLTVSFMAEERVDFREFVRALSTELHTQIEMIQIGVRDTARLVGGFGPCGQELCCRRWLKSFEVVTVKMAKVQRLSLSPNTISGMCGRLKCCLRYEHDGYRSCAERFPRDGARVRCPRGIGSVTDKNILGERVKLRMEDGRILEYALREIEPA